MMKMVFVFLMLWLLVISIWTGSKAMTGRDKLMTLSIILKSCVAAGVAVIILSVFVFLF